MKVWPIILLIASCQAQVIFSPKNPDDFGTSVTFQNQDVLGQYDFGYSEGHPSGATFRRESGDAFGNKVGSYGLKLADGSTRIVQYFAGPNGFEAKIVSNEAGVAPQNPASVSINKPAILLPAAPAISVAQGPAPIVVPPPPPPLPVALPSKAFPPPPISYNYIAPPAPAVAIPQPPLPPPAYFPTRFAAPVAPIAAPISPIAKGVVAYPPLPPPPPPSYYTNLVPGKGYVSTVRNYPSLFPPLSAVPPQYNYLNLKSPPLYQAVSLPL